MNRFEEKIGFFTGGGSGIGLACAKVVAAGGGHVTLAGRRSEVLQSASDQLGVAADFLTNEPSGARLPHNTASPPSGRIGSSAE